MPMESQHPYFSGIMPEIAVPQVPDKLGCCQEENHQNDGGKTEPLVRKWHHVDFCSIYQTRNSSICLNPSPTLTFSQRME